MAAHALAQPQLHTLEEVKPGPATSLLYLFF